MDYEPTTYSRGNDSVCVDGVKCPKDPHALIEYADEFVPVLLGRLNQPCMSHKGRCEVKETLERLMDRVLNANSEGDSEMDRYTRGLKDYVDETIFRDQTRQLFSINSNPVLGEEYELLVDIEDRILGMIEELNDSGLESGQRFLNKDLIELAVSEMKQIRSASAPIFREKIEELNVIATKAIREVNVKALKREREAPSEFRDLSTSLHFWEDEFSLFHLDRLFSEPIQSA